MKKGSKYKPKIPKKVKFPLDRAYTKILPKVYERMNYTPQEFWLKFTQYLERSDKNSEEICISGFAVYAQTSSDFLNQHRTSKDFSSVVEAIMTCFESRYEQKGIKGISISYIMNNRFKGKRESLSKSEDTIKLPPNVGESLDFIIKKTKKKNGDK